METLVPQDHRSLAPFLARRAEILVRAGARDEAVAALERAVALYQRGEGDPRASAGARFALARVLWDRAAERPRALELASAARAELDGLGDAAAAERKPIEAWLAARR